MGKPTVARALDPFRYHDVTLALSKARAMASVLIDLGPEADNDLVDALRDGSHPEETLEWLHSVVSDTLRGALDEAEAAFRKSITPEEAHRQTLERTGPKAVA